MLPAAVAQCFAGDVMYFQFMDDVMFSHNEENGPKSDDAYVFRWLHRGRTLPSPTAYCVTGNCRCTRCTANECETLEITFTSDYTFVETNFNKSSVSSEINDRVGRIVVNIREFQCHRSSA